MWKLSSRSPALDRVQALLSAKRSRGDGGSTQDRQGGFSKSRSVPPNSQTLLSDLSELSSESSASDPAGQSARPASTQDDAERKEESDKDLAPQRSLGERSRFLKKVPKPANSSHSPVSRNQAQPVVEPRYVSSSQSGSQAPALRRLAEIERRVRRRKQELEQAKRASASALSLTSDRISPPADIQSAEASAEASARSDSDQSQRGNRFLKKRTAAAAERTSTASPEAAEHQGVASRSRAADRVVHSGRLERKPRGLVSAVSLESDEEDMKKLLGDSMESVSISGPGRPSTAKIPHRTLSGPSKKVERSARPSPARGATPPLPPASPSRRGSPFRFTGLAQAQFSPSLLSPSPSPPRVPPSQPERRGSSQKPESPRRSHSSSSSRANIRSLEELFPEEPLSRTSSVSSEEFKINVMTLEELIPSVPGTVLEMPGTQVGKNEKLAEPGHRSQSRHQQSPWVEKEVEEEEAVLGYLSDFNSESGSGQIVKQLGEDDEEEAQVRSEVILEVSETHESRKETDKDYSSTFSEPSYSSVSDRSQTSERSRSLRTRSSRSSTQHSRRRGSRRNFRDTAVQTGPDRLADSWSTGAAPLDPQRIYMEPTFVASHTMSAERLEAISTFDPAVFALNEMLRQQLAMTKQFIEGSEQLHSRLLRSLEPPSYRYTTLEDTVKIWRRRHPKPTMEKV